MASTIAFSLAVFAALGIALWQAGIARQEAARATEQTHRAETVRDFLVSVFEAADTEQPREHRPGIEDLVDDATRRALGDTSLRADTRADLLATLARVNESLGAHEQALAAIDAALPLVADRRMTSVCACACSALPRSRPSRVRPRPSPNSRRCAPRSMHATTCLASRACSPLPTPCPATTSSMPR